MTQREDDLYLAHSKLRPASLGPELLVGDLPLNVEGVSHIRRGREAVWEKPFLSGEQNMAHTIANLEAHHFKYALFRRPGEVHVHFFGTATLSVSDGFKTEKGDVFEIESEPFGLPLRNRLADREGQGGRRANVVRIPPDESGCLVAKRQSGIEPFQSVAAQSNVCNTDLVPQGAAPQGDECRRTSPWAERPSGRLLRRLLRTRSVSGSAPPWRITTFDLPFSVPPSPSARVGTGRPARGRKGRLLFWAHEKECI